MTPKTIDECYKRLGLTHRPTHLEMVTTAKLREMVRSAWNFATAAERERQRETTNDDAAISELAGDIAALALNSDVTNEAGETLSVREVVGRYLRPIEAELNRLRKTVREAAALRANERWAERHRWLNKRAMEKKA